MGALADRYMMPPFSVIDTRGGWWRTRKRRWNSIGIASDLSREGMLPGGLNQWAGNCEDGPGRGEITRAGASSSDTASIFDPVLCELIYRWWAPRGATILDPFAGGSVRGITAAMLGHTYHGVDLREAQVEANRGNAADVLTRHAPHATPPTWHVGDATRTRDIDALPDRVDLVFSCPPYADLEVYSDDPRDLSTMGYEKFRKLHALAITQACARLRNNSFAVWVIGEARDGTGGLYGLIPDTIRAFTAAGLEYTSEGVLLTPAGNAPLRAARGFDGGRVLTRCHQNVLLFTKGDRGKAAKRLGGVDTTDVLPRARRAA